MMVWGRPRAGPFHFRSSPPMTSLHPSQVRRRGRGQLSVSFFGAATRQVRRLPFRALTLHNMCVDFSTRAESAPQALSCQG